MRATFPGSADVTRYLIRFDDGSASIVEADRIVSFEERAQQYLLEQSIDVLYADGDYVSALCQGYSKTYRLGYEKQRGWWCSCRIQGECPHLIALKGVVGTTAEHPRKAEVEAELEKARRRMRAEIEEDPVFVAQRVRAEQVPRLEAEVEELREIANEVPRLQAELGERTAEIARLQGDMKAERARAASEVKAQRARLEGEIKRRHELLQQETERATKLGTALRSLQRRRTELEDALGRAREVAARVEPLEAQLGEREERINEAERELARLRDEVAKLPALEATLAQQALRLSELKADLAQRVSQHRLELMERDIRLNELQMDAQRAQARASVLSTGAVARRPRRAAPSSPALNATPSPDLAPPAENGASRGEWTDYSVPALRGRPTGNGSAQDARHEADASG